MAFTKIAAAGIGSTETVTLDGLTVINNVSIGGTLTYEDVTNVDSVGLITARNGIVVGSGITLSKDGDGFFTGVITATSYSGIDLSDVTGATGDFSIADKIVHTGDTDTAIRFSGADTIKLETGGSERLRVDSTGQTIVSGTLFADADLFMIDKLRHTGDTDTAIRFPEVDKVTVETSGSERLAIEPSGNTFIHQGVLVGSAVTVGTSSSTSTLIDKGFIELTRSSGDTYIDFRNAFSDDFDARIITSGGNQLQFFTGGQGSTFCALQTGTGKVAIATDVSPSISKLEIHSDKLGGTAGNTQEIALLKSPDISNSTTYRFTNYRKSNGTNHVTSELRFRRHVDLTDMGYFGLGDGYASIGYGNDERMRVTNDGYVTKPYTPSFSAKGSTDAISASSPLPYDSTGGINHNNGGHYSTSTYKFTCPVDGYYYVTCHVVPTNFDVGYNVELYVADNSGNRHFLDRKVKTISEEA